MSSVRSKLLSLSTRPWTWIVMIVVFQAVNFVLGPYWEVAVLVALPVVLATWHRGLRWGVPLAILLPALRFTMLALKGWPVSWPLAALNFLNRAAVFVFLVYLIARVARHTRELKQRVKTLEGILPVCCFCKNIREKDEWHRMEQYIERHSEAQFSHGCCPGCLEKHYGAEMAGDI